jgi:PPP family 3-phenylpropionic acid transporter
MQYQSDDTRAGVAIAGYYFFSLAGLAILWPYLPLYWKSLGYSSGAVGTFLTALGLGGLLAQIPVGYLSDRGGHRRTLVAGAMAVCTLVTLTYPLARSYASLLAGAFLMGASFRSADALVQAIAGDVAASGRMAGWFGKLRIAGSVSWMASLAVSARVAFLTDWKPFDGAVWTAPMFVCIAFCYAAAGAIVYFARPTPPSTRLHLSPLGALKAVAATPGLKRFLVAFALYWTGLQSVGAFLSLLLKDMGGSNTVVSAAYAVSALAELPFMYASGRLADTFGERRVLLFSFGALPARLLLYAVASSPLVVVAAQMLHGVTYGLMFVAAVAYMNHRLPANLRASGQGALGVVMSVAQTLAPFLGGLAANAMGYRGMYAAMAGIAVAALAVARGLPAGQERVHAHPPAGSAVRD